MIDTELLGDSGLLVFKPKNYKDSRGVFAEIFRQEEIYSYLGNYNFVQHNISESCKNVIRGLHYQVNKPQGKLIWVAQGKIFDVCVDIRKYSKTFGKHYSIELNEKDNFVLWVPVGFAHGFLSLSDCSKIEYKCTEYYSPSDERGILWNDNVLNIGWPLTDSPIVSEKDSKLSNFLDAEYFP
jgi:dTDP-4-dehydrorhamnose 3,5-epimerase